MQKFDNMNNVPKSPDKLADAARVASFVRTMAAVMDAVEPIADLDVFVFVFSHEDYYSMVLE